MAEKNKKEGTKWKKEWSEDDIDDSLTAEFKADSNTTQDTNQSAQPNKTTGEYRGGSDGGGFGAGGRGGGGRDGGSGSRGGGFGGERGFYPPAAPPAYYPAGPRGRGWYPAPAPPPVSYVPIPAPAPDDGSSVYYPPAPGGYVPAPPEDSYPQDDNNNDNNDNNNDNTGPRGGSDSEPADQSNQFFVYPGLSLNEGEKVRVYFTFFASPTYCQTLAFTLTGPNVTAPEPTFQPTPEPSPDSNSTDFNSTDSDSTDSNSPDSDSTDPTSSSSPSSPSSSDTNTSLSSDSNTTNAQSSSTGSAAGQYTQQPPAQARGTRRPSPPMPAPRVVQQRAPGAFQSDDRKEEGEMNKESSSNESERYQEESQVATCASTSNFFPSVVPIAGLTNAVEDQNNFAINFEPPAANSDQVMWLDVHYTKQADSQRNYRMEHRAEGVFEHIQPGWNEGIHLACDDSLDYWFTYRLGPVGLTECDTQHFSFVNQCASPSSSSSFTGGDSKPFTASASTGSSQS